MGDTGAFALGGAIAAMAIMMKVELLLLLVGGIFAINALSVILQVVSFKYWGRRIFLMAPLQHHFEMKAWSETKIMVRFWIVTAIFCAAGFALFYKYFLAVPRPRVRALVYGLARSGPLGGGTARRPGARRPLARERGRPLAARRRRRARQVARRSRRGAARRRGPRARHPRLVGGRARLPPAARRATSSASRARTARRRRPSCSARSSAPPAATSPSPGNVGTPLTSVRDAPPGSCASCRSFQLEDVHELACDVAVLLNLEPDHLDRHGSFEAYRDAKLRIFERSRAQVVPRGLRARRGSSSPPTTSCPRSRCCAVRTIARTPPPPPRPRARPGSRTSTSPPGCSPSPGCRTGSSSWASATGCATSTTRRRRTSRPRCARSPPTPTSRCT